ncbi:MAG: hypothetical protein RSB38_07180 [Oscillospiraceae bacterium]
MTKIELQENQHSLEINNKEYPIAKRTGELEKRLIAEYDTVLHDLTEYERYKTLITLLLGESAYIELFPLGESENLNKMAQIAYHAQKEFNADYEELEKQKMKEQGANVLKDIDLITKKFDSLSNSVDKIISKSEIIKTANHKKK